MVAARGEDSCPCVISDEEMKRSGEFKAMMNREESNKIKRSLENRERFDMEAVHDQHYVALGHEDPESISDYAVKKRQVSFNLSSIPGSQLNVNDYSIVTETEKPRHVPKPRIPNQIRSRSLKRSQKSEPGHDSTSIGSYGANLDKQYKELKSAYHNYMEKEESKILNINPGQADIMSFHSRERSIDPTDISRNLKPLVFALNQNESAEIRTLLQPPRTAG